MGKPLVISDRTVSHQLYSPIVKTLLYFDIFHYPLKIDEILNFISIRTTIDELQRTLDEMEARKLIFRHEMFYSVHSGDADVIRRKAGNELAEDLMPLAEERAKLISKFPFIRGVMGSGSLAKGYMDKDSDFDFFIVTAENRLWIARMILVLYKRLFLRNSSKEFCVNYFVTSQQLQIEEQNHFTATELATVIPFVAQLHYLNLLRDNAWLYDFFPNYSPRPVNLNAPPNPWHKGTAEVMLNFLGGTMLDNFCMWITKRRWKRMYGKIYGRDDFNVAFKSKKGVSKGHPKHYQRKVSDLLNEKWNWYVQNFSFSSYE